jgi:hypothetical protein
MKGPVKRGATDQVTRSAATGNDDTVVNLATKRGGNVMSEALIGLVILMLLWLAVFGIGVKAAESGGAKLGQVGIAWCVFAILLMALVPLLSKNSSQTLVTGGLLKFLLLSIGIKLIVVAYCEKMPKRVAYFLGLLLPSIGLIWLDVIADRTAKGTKFFNEIESLLCYVVIIFGVALLTSYVERIADHRLLKHDS